MSEQSPYGPPPERGDQPPPLPPFGPPADSRGDQPPPTPPHFGQEGEREETRPLDPWAQDPREQQRRDQEARGGETREQPAFAEGAPGRPQAGEGAPVPSPYGQPQYGQPQYDQPQYDQPQYGQPQYGQPQYGQPYPQAFAGDQPKREISGMAVAGLVVSIFAVLTTIILIGGLIGVMGLIFSIVGIVATGAQKRRGRGLAVTGLILSIVAMVGAIFVFFVFSVMYVQIIERYDTNGDGVLSEEELQLFSEDYGLSSAGPAPAEPVAAGAPQSLDATDGFDLIPA